MIAPLSRNPILILLAALVAVMADVFLMGYTALPLMLPSVTAAGPYGYDGPRPEQPYSISIDPAGAYDAEYAWAAYTRRSLRSATVPFWNPYQGLGQPQLANYVSGVIYPVNWLALLLPPAWWDLLFLTNWFLTAYFVFLLGRVLGFGRRNAVVGGFAVFAAGFFEGFLAVKSIIGTVAWFPFLIYAVERALLQPTWRWRHLALAGGTYCLATGGHPAPALMGVVLVVLYALARVAIGKGAWRPLFAEILPSIVVGGLVAAPLWLPFAEHVLYDGIAVHGDDQGMRHFPWRGLALSVFPFLYGPVNLDIWGNEHAGLAWSPASVTFLALVGLFAVARRRTAGMLSLTLVAGLAAAKIFGAPIINDIGRLPLLNQFPFTYANGFVAIGLCALAGAGFAHLTQRPAREWVAPLAVWGVFVMAMLAIGIATIGGESVLLDREPWRTKYFYATLAAGLGWAVGFPAGLLIAWRRSSRPSGAALLVAASGLLLQAVACFPSGSPRGFVIVNAASAAAFGAVVLLATLVGRRMRSSGAVAGALLITAGTVAIVVSMWPRLPGRYNPLTPAPYVDMLVAVPNAPRVYPLQGVLFPNFAAPFGLSSITNLDNLVTRQGAAFFSRFLDPGVHPARFYGMEAARNPASPDPVAEFWKRKRYWDFIGVRYLLAVDRDLNTQVVAESPVSGAVRDPIPLFMPLETRVSCSGGSFDTVSVLLATYARPQPGRVTVDAVDARGGVVASAVVDAPALVDNAEQHFPLPNPACPDGQGEVVLRLSFHPGVPGAMIAAWQYPAWQGSGFVFRALRTAGATDLRVTYRDPRSRVIVWENLRVAERAFLAPIVETVPDAEAAMDRLDQTPDLTRTVFVEGPIAAVAQDFSPAPSAAVAQDFSPGPSAAVPVAQDFSPALPPAPGALCRGNPSWPADAQPGRLISLRLSPNVVQIDYDARTAGVLTLTDAHARGWRASVDGREVQLLRVNGAFRGVCIDGVGRHRVEFRYRPPRWWAALTLCGVGALGLAALVVARRRADYRVAQG